MVKYRNVEKAAKVVTECELVKQVIYELATDTPPDCLGNSYQVWEKMSITNKIGNIITWSSKVSSLASDLLLETDSGIRCRPIENEQVIVGISVTHVMEIEPIMVSDPEYMFSETAQFENDFEIQRFPESIIKMQLKEIEES